MKKILRSTALFTLMLSMMVAGNAATSQAASSNAATAYQNFVTQQKAKKTPASIYTATMKSGKGEDILLVSDSLSGNKAYSAKIYQYVNDKVTYIGEVNSSEANQPICKCGNYLSLVTSPTSSQDIIVANGKATDYRLNGLNTKKKSVTIKQFTLKSNKRSLVSTKQMLRKKVQNKDYFWLTGKHAKWIPIKFKKA